MKTVSEARLARMLGNFKRLDPADVAPVPRQFTPGAPREDNAGMKITPYTWPGETTRDAEGYELGASTVRPGQRRRRSIGQFMQGGSRPSASDT